MINILFFILYLLTHPDLWPAALKGSYMPVYLQYSWLKGRDIKTFIDVGAHEGAVSKVMRSLFPDIKIFAFEPIESLAKALKNNLKGIEVINAAVGDRDGKVIFHTTDYAPASSVRPLSQNFKDKFKTANDIEAKMITLDSYFKKHEIKRPVLLKIDVQGFEREVVNGGKNTLKHVDIIHIESSLVEVYEGQALFDELHKKLSDLGFVYHGTSADGEFIPKFAPQEFQNSLYFRS